ncbi:MAG: hypothetical protein K6A36_03410 [Paludibacteraceae bacterium]|nr:hypothetical protein [Paludibacteraceae bacterium]
MKRKLFILLSVCVTIAAMAQLPHSYSCDFEDAAENARWNLNTPKNENYTWVNTWTIGSGVSSLGAQSLYISADGGTTAGYKLSDSRTMIAWRELTLEAGTYDLSFDWMCGGDSTRAALLVAWVPEDKFDDMFCLLSSKYRDKEWVAENLLKFTDGSVMLNGGSVWTHASVEGVVSNGRPHRLVYLFVYDKTAQLVQPGPCVDNIGLARNNCGKPTDLTVSTMGQTTRFTWQSAAESFNLRYYRMGENEATEIRDVRSKSYSTVLSHGVYNVQIQVVCQGDTSVWYDFPVVFIYDARCVRYLNLTDDNCFYSEETADNWQMNDTLLRVGQKKDYGFTSMWSRHTIHYNPEEYDARTNGSVDSEGNPVAPLKTVPDGELASVRVGSWEKTARVARIVYDFTVDAKDAGVLMLKYALVLESSGHKEEQRPRFTINIVDAETGAELSECTTVDLSSKTNGDGWNRVPDGTDTGTRDVCWRDWTTLGLNLADYDGRHVKVVLTAMGCTAEIHYGYAYFILNCISGNIEGIQCGNTPTNEFIAPEGFDYRWYKLSAPSETLSRNRIYPVDYRDTEDYAVDVMYKSNKKDCKFTLYANAIPRFPIPEATYTLEQRDCGNYIRFRNMSHIRTRNWLTGETIDTKKRPDAMVWDFGGLMPDSLMRDSIPWNPAFRLPDEEADYHFTLRAMVGLCDSTQDFYIHVPHVGKDSVVESVQRCVGDLYEHNGRYYSGDTVIVDESHNLAGCDSTHVINLRFVDAIRDTVNAVIPEGENYLFGEEQLTIGGEYTSTFMSASGCDSIVTLYLRVVVPLEVELTGLENPCPEDASFLIYTCARKGVYNYYALRFSDEAFAEGWLPQSDSIYRLCDTVEVSLPANVKPGYYPFTIRFDSKENGSYELTGEVMVHYSATLIQQRWDDVLGILNADYNGGYDFVSFQWLHNGKEIEGATGSYLYKADKLQAGDEYAVLLTTSAGGRAIPTCAYIVPATQQSAPAVSTQKQLQNGRLYIIVEGRTYNAQGYWVK